MPMPNQALVPVNTTLDLCVVMPLIVAAPVAVIVSVLSPVKVGLVNGAFSAKVDASDVPLSVIAGVDMLPVVIKPESVVVPNAVKKLDVMLNVSVVSLIPKYLMPFILKSMLPLLAVLLMIVFVAVVGVIVMFGMTSVPDIVVVP